MRRALGIAAVVLTAACNRVPTSTKVTDPALLTELEGRAPEKYDRDAHLQKQGASPRAPQLGRFQVLNHTQLLRTLMLVDTATGETWQICGDDQHPETGTAWCAMPRLGGSGVAHVPVAATGEVEWSDPWASPPTGEEIGRAVQKESPAAKRPVGR